MLTNSAKFKMAVRTEDFSNAEQQIDGISGEKYREIGDQAVWSLSSCKPGFGVEQLRDGNLETYWQSDGPQPHLISIQFRRKTAIQNLCLYADYKADESYTPSKISIRAGNHFHDLHQIELIELEEPSGWLTVSLSDGDKPLRTYMLQIAVLANHQNGRDTHMRQIKIHAPLTDSGTYKMPTFTSVECAMYSTIKTFCWNDAAEGSRMALIEAKFSEGSPTRFSCSSWKENKDQTGFGNNISEFVGFLAAP